MDGLIISRSEHHDYTYLGQTYPGVTGILKVLDKSGPLMAWAAKNTAEAAIALHMGDGLAALLDTVGVDGAIKALTSRSDWKRDEAAQLGTEVHSLAELVVTGRPTPAMAENVRSRVLAYAKWWEASGWSVRAAEALLVNPEMGYGGTLDLMAYDRDRATVLADIKTGRAVYNETALQLTAYSLGKVLAVSLPAGGQAAYTMPAVDRFVILHVLADEVREVEVPVGALEREAWAACVKLAQWRESIKGRKL